MRGAAFVLVAVALVSAAHAEGSGTIDLTSLYAQVTAHSGQIASLQSQTGSQQAAVGTLQSQMSSAQSQMTTVQGQTPQSAQATTDGNGLWSVTWSRPFAGAAPFVAPQPLNAAASNAVVCNVTARTALAASGKCWALGTLAAASGFPVMIFGRDLTQ